MRELVVTIRVKVATDRSNLNVQETIEYFLDGVFEGDCVIESIVEVEKEKE